MNSTVLFYTSPGCSNCRKAKKWLDENHINYVEKNVFSSDLTEREIKYLMARCENGTDDIISTRSKTYALLNGKLEDMTIQELTTFIQDNPSILKRPILLSERSMTVGYDHDEITSLVPRRKTEAGSMYIA